MVREIVFDTETTGLSPESGDKIVEIGAIELINHMPTGKVYHQYINPQREVPQDAINVHGLTNDFLQKYPVFADVAQDFLDFVGEDGILVAHNASFDMKFVNFELNLLGLEKIDMERVVDTLVMARKKFPGAKNNLDALCKRFGVDNSSRTNHGALLDSELLAKVYLELMGGAEPSMLISSDAENKSNEVFVVSEKTYRETRSFAISAEEEKEHLIFLENKLKNALWLNKVDE